MLNASVIHQDFCSAPERLRQEAHQRLRQLLPSSPPPLDVDRQKALGFSTTTSRVPQDTVEQTQYEEQLSQLVYYEQKYPSYPFIVESEVQRLCYRYGLVFGPVAHYIGTVPEKNLEQLEQMQVAEIDRKPQNVHVYRRRYPTSRNADTSTGNHQNNSPAQDDLHYEVAGQLTDLGRWRLEATHQWIDLVQRPQPLWIAGDGKDFDWEGQQLRQGYRMTPAVPDDPIVFCPVKGGYLIITAWGPEALGFINPIDSN